MDFSFIYILLILNIQSVMILLPISTDEQIFFNQNAHLITRLFFFFFLTSRIKSSYFNFLLTVQPQLNLFILSQLHMSNRVFLKLYKGNQIQINITIK